MAKLSKFAAAPSASLLSSPRCCISHKNASATKSPVMMIFSLINKSCSPGRGLGDHTTTSDQVKLKKSKADGGTQPFAVQVGLPVREEVVRLLVLAELLKSASQSSGWTWPPRLMHNTYEWRVLCEQSGSRGLWCVTECLPVGLDKQGLHDVLLP